MQWTNLPAHYVDIARHTLMHSLLTFIRHVTNQILEYTVGKLSK